MLTSSLKSSLDKLALKLGQLKSLKIQLGTATKTFVGIDVGTSSLKIVELTKAGGRIRLENYGEMVAPSFYKEPFRRFRKTTLLLSSEDIAKSIKGIYQEAKLKSRNAVFSIPDFSTFFTTFTLPPMTREELDQAVEYEARQHIPLPLSGITTDWQVVSGRISNGRKQGTPLGIILVAVPNEVVNQYQEIAQLAELNLVAIEAEVFSLARSSASLEKGVVILVEIGDQSTTVTVVDDGFIKLSHSFDVGGNEFTWRISQALNIDYEAAEKLKKEQGLTNYGQLKTSIKDILLPFIDLIIKEIEKVSKHIASENKKPEKIILTGGSALLPGLIEYISSTLKQKVVLADPFNLFFYPPILESTLKEMGPSWAVAVGAAMRGLE